MVHGTGAIDVLVPMGIICVLRGTVPVGDDSPVRMSSPAQKQACDAVAAKGYEGFVMR
jgi:hypothetical protein